MKTICSIVFKCCLIPIRNFEILNLNIFELGIEIQNVDSNVFKCRFKMSWKDFKCCLIPIRNFEILILNVFKKELNWIELLSNVLLKWFENYSIYIASFPDHASVKSKSQSEQVSYTSSEN